MSEGQWLPATESFRSLESPARPESENDELASDAKPKNLQYLTHGDLRFYAVS